MSNRKTFIKWAGGKEKELPIILKNLPSNFDRYVEPFVGGGAVYLNYQKMLYHVSLSFYKVTSIHQIYHL